MGGGGGGGVEGLGIGGEWRYIGGEWSGIGGEWRGSGGVGDRRGVEGCRLILFERGQIKILTKFYMLYAPFLADRLWSNVNFIFM